MLDLMNQVGDIPRRSDKTALPLVACVVCCELNYTQGCLHLLSLGMENGLTPGLRSALLILAMLSGIGSWVVPDFCRTSYECPEYTLLNQNAVSFYEGSWICIVLSLYLYFASLGLFAFKVHCFVLNDVPPVDVLLSGL